jgi:hypothetical protein
MPWRMPLSKPITLADGCVLETLGDVGRLLTSDRFNGVSRSPALEYALELLLKASETGDLLDIQVAAAQATIALHERKLLR